MPFDKIIDIETESISSGGGTATAEYTANEDYVINEFMIQEKGGNTLNDVPATIYIDGEVFTKDEVNLGEFQLSYNQIPTWNQNLDDNDTLKFDITNNDSAARDLRIMLFVETRG